MGHRQRLKLNTNQAQHTNEGGFGSQSGTGEHRPHLELKSPSVDRQVELDYTHYDDYRPLHRL